MRHHEKKWLKHKLPSTWIAYKKVRNTYYGKLNSRKKLSIRKQITDCANDSKKLYSLVKNLTNKPTLNQWPVHTDKEILAEEFAEFFQNKILKIRQLFNGIEQYDAITNTSVPIFRKFAPLTEKQVMLIIKQMKTKTCELDDLPTNILKRILPRVIPLITKIVNISLDNGDFSSKWKMAVVRPLIKKVGLQLIKSNFRPVSNLAFISKSWKGLCSDNCQALPRFQSAARLPVSIQTQLLL